MEKKEYKIDQTEYDEKIAHMEEAGMKPMEIKKMNPAFFNAIVVLMGINLPKANHPVNENNYMYEKGSRSLREKTMPKKKDPNTDMTDAEKEAKVLENIAKLKRKPSGKYNQKGKHRKK